jgi:transcriptional regulator with XRE-family HTH domain
MKGFHMHVRRLREAKAMTRYRLAKLSGLSAEGISKLEKPGSDPKLSTLYKVAAALGVTVCDLLPGRGATRRARGNKATGAQDHNNQSI